jgi:hypothetical protein
MADTKVPPLSDAARAALSKLETPEAIAVMEHMHQLDTGDNNNFQNNSRLQELQSISREELMKNVDKIPTESLRNLLQNQGII